MSEENITNLIKKIHEEEVHRNIIREILDEPDTEQENTIHQKLTKLLDKQVSPSPKIVQFPMRNVCIAQTNLLAAAGQKLSDWFAEPLVFAGTGMVVDIRKVLDSPKDVDVYIHSIDSDTNLIAQCLLPYRGSTRQFRLSINGKEIMCAEMYIDDSGELAEGSGTLREIDEKVLHGEVHLDIIIDDERN